MEETPLKGKDERKTKRRKLKKVLPKVKDDFSVRAEKGGEPSDEICHV